MSTIPSGFTAIRPLLSRLGLEAKEIEVYLALLPLKVGRATDIAKAAKQSRSHAYLVLRSLKEKGLVSEVERGKITHFIAEPPERLLVMIEERERDLRSLVPLVEGIIPLLTGLTKPLAGAPRVTTLTGNAGMRQLYLDALKNEICGIFNPQTMFDAFGGNIVTILFGKHAQLRGRDLLVQGAASVKYVEEVGQSDTYTIRFLPEGAFFQTDTIVFGDTVALFSYDDQNTIIRIQSGNIADSFRAWFEVLWKASSPAL